MPPDEHDGEKNARARPAKTPVRTSTTQLPRLIREGICRVNAHLDMRTSTRAIDHDDHAARMRRAGRPGTNLMPGGRVHKIGTRRIVGHAAQPESGPKSLRLFGIVRRPSAHDPTRKVCNFSGSCAVRLRMIRPEKSATFRDRAPFVCA
jgi:hypothetical protein